MTFSEKIIKIPTPGKKYLPKVSKSPTLGQGKAVIYPSVLVAHKRKAINNVPKPQLNFYTEHFNSLFVNQKFGFIKRVDKREITTVKDLEIMYNQIPLVIRIGYCA